MQRCCQVGRELLSPSSPEGCAIVWHRARRKVEEGRWGLGRRLCRTHHAKATPQNADGRGLCYKDTSAATSAKPLMHKYCSLPLTMSETSRGGRAVARSAMLSGHSLPCTWSGRAARALGSQQEFSRAQPSCCSTKALQSRAACLARVACWSPPGAGLSLLLLLQVCTASTRLSICATTLLALPALSPTSLLRVTAWTLAAGGARERAFLVPGSCLLYSGGVCGDPELWDEAVRADNIKEVQRPERLAEDEDHLQCKPYTRSHRHEGEQSGSGDSESCKASSRPWLQGLLQQCGVQL